MGRFLREQGSSDKSKAGKMMIAVGKAQSYSAQQRSDQLECSSFSHFFSDGARTYSLKDKCPDSLKSIGHCPGD